MCKLLYCNRLRLYTVKNQSWKSGWRTSDGARDLVPLATGNWQLRWSSSDPTDRILPDMYLGGAISGAAPVASPFAAPSPVAADALRDFSPTSSSLQRRRTPRTPSDMIV